MSRSLKKGPFVDTSLLEKIEVMNRGGREEGHQDLVAPVDGDPRDGRAHARRAQREEVHPGVHHREHGRPQARRVRADAAVQGPHDQGGREGGDGRAAAPGRPAAAAKPAGGGGVMIEAQATARYVRTSAQKAGWCSTLIRGKDVNRALATLKFTRKGVARRHREGAAVGDRQRAAEGRVQRRRRSAVRVGVLRQPGAVAEAGAPGADGPRVPRAEAHGAPHRAGVRAAGEGRAGGRRRQTTRRGGRARERKKQASAPSAPPQKAKE